MSGESQLRELARRFADGEIIGQTAYAATMVGVLQRAADALQAPCVGTSEDLGSVGSGLTPLVPSREDDTGPAPPSESWHERLKRLVAAGDYPAALALLRAPAPKADGAAHLDLNAWADPFLGWPDPAQHDYWRPGNPDCPAKAPSLPDSQTSGDGE
jgi:hypothetical protein